MAEDIQGEISFINHERGYCTIEYNLNGKKKTINGNISDKDQQKLIDEKIIKRKHRFYVGDVVNFIIVRSPRGDKQVADCIRYLYNNAMDNLLNKAKTENEFVGYLKKVDEEYFVKETGSYIFFDLKLSPWELKPSGKLNEPIFFKLENFESPEKVYARLRKSHFIPEYHTAEKLFKSKTPIEASVYNVSPHAIYLDIIKDKIKAKLTTDKLSKPATIKAGDKIKVMITFLSPSRIIVEAV